MSYMFLTCWLIFALHTSSFRYLLLRCCCGEEGHWIWLQRSPGEEILPHWTGEICRLEHSRRNSGVHGFDSVGRHWRQIFGGGWVTLSVKHNPQTKVEWQQLTMLRLSYGVRGAARRGPGLQYFIYLCYSPAFCFAVVSSYFLASCAPGADRGSKLCQLCKGDCSRSHKEPYYDYAGAFQSVSVFIWSFSVLVGLLSYLMRSYA